MKKKAKNKNNKKENWVFIDKYVNEDNDTIYVLLNTKTGELERTR